MSELLSRTSDIGGTIVAAKNAKKAPNKRGMKAIDGRYELSFTSGTHRTGINNWNVLNERANWEINRKLGNSYFAEIVDLASKNEESAFAAAVFAITSCNWDGLNGVEQGFANALVKAAFVGLRMMRAGVDDSMSDFDYIC